MANPKGAWLPPDAGTVKRATACEAARGRHSDFSWPKLNHYGLGIITAVSILYQYSILQNTTLAVNDRSIYYHSVYRPSPHRFGTFPVGRDVGSDFEIEKSMSG